MTQSTIALTIGDPNGIGPEIVVSARQNLPGRGGPAVVLVDDEFVVRFSADLLRERPEGSGRSMTWLPGQIFCGCWLSMCVVAARSLPGAPLAAGGRATVDYVAVAIRFVNDGHAAAIVACSRSGTNVKAPGIPLSSYSSLLARLMNVPEDEVFLMVVGGGLRIILVTLRERLHTAFVRITSELIERATRTADAARQKLNVEQPHIGWFGINPHAGEGGLFGDDDDRTTVPTANRMQALGLNVGGPLGADLMLGRRDFDAFVAMYHDRGRILVKLPAGRNSATLSIGSPVFSSVGHGSAFDIAGRDVPEPEAVVRSIQLLGGAFHFGDVAVS